MEEVAIMVSVPGQLYEKKKQSFQDFRNKYKLSHIILSPEHHMWSGNNGEFLEVIYTHGQNGILVDAKIKWKNTFIDPFFMDMMKIFMEEKE